MMAFYFGFILLVVAGNETTRNAITHGMNAFLDNPDQWDLWKRERPSTMVDEVIRWATPVTVTRPIAERRRIRSMRHQPIRSARHSRRSCVMSSNRSR